MLPDVTTDAAGQFSVNLPVGVYTVTFVDPGCPDSCRFENEEVTISVAAGQDVDLTVQLTPLDAVVVYNLGGTNHTFDVGTEICGQCHGAYDGGTLQQTMAAALAALNAHLGAAALAKLNSPGRTLHVRADDEATGLYSSAGSTDANVAIDTAENPVTQVVVESGHGQIELGLTPTTPITITWSDGSQTTTDHFGVQVRALKEDAGGLQGADVYATSGNFLKGAWNLLPVEHDRSGGVHNPTFYFNVIAATMAQDVTS